MKKRKNEKKNLIVLHSAQGPTILTLISTIGNERGHEQKMDPTLEVRKEIRKTEKS